MEHYLRRRKRVLWLAWDVTLLAQAVTGLIEQYVIPIDSGVLAFLGKYGGAGILSRIPSLQFGAGPVRAAIIAYGTMQSIGGYVESGVAPHLRPDLIVIDEAHLGIGGEFEREVFRFADRRGVDVLGLSGTPKSRPGWSNAASPISFCDLAEAGYLATPVVEAVATNRNFQGELVAGANLISPSTYDRIGRDPVRN